MEQNPDFSGRNIVGESLTWGHSQLATFVTGSRFQSCDITIACGASGIIGHDNEFIDCTIRVKRFANFQFFYDEFEGCRFIGKFPGCEFGFRDGFPVGKRHGCLRNCDFTQAVLDLVGFNDGADLPTLRLPPWPHFLVPSYSAMAMV